MTKRTLYRLLNLAGGALALGAAVPMAARFLEPSHDTPVPQLAAFGPWAVPLWVLAGMLLLVGRRRRTGAAVLVVTAAVTALAVHWQVPPAAARDSARPASAAGTRLRVMTLNVEFGRGDVAQAAALVRDRQVDVLVVEELTEDWASRFRATGIETQLAYTDLHPRERAAGTGIWSRWPLRATGTLPSAGFQMPQVEIAVPAGPAGSTPRGVAVTGVHTRAPVPRVKRLTGWRADLAMIARTERARDKSSGPQLYVGDFNSSRDQAGFRAILATGLVDAADAVPAASWPGFTWPVDRPGPAFTRIDHILLTPSSIGVRDVTVVTVAGTDHHGVIADLLVLP